MTISGYLMVMTKVGIAELKARLSHFVKLARRGRVVTVLDRDTPVAQLAPLPHGTQGLSIRSAVPGAPPLGRVPLPPPLELPVDVLELLGEERADRR
jgi:antitoxin (DNA-binding transcriptional repressor) of toxin-antitoxin stability system